MSRLRDIRWSHLGTAFMFAFAVLVVQFSGALAGTASAADGEAVWTGTAGDGKFSTASNWEGSTLPMNGDTLVFTSNTSEVNTVNIENDLSVKYAGVKMIDVSAQSYGSVYYDIDTLTLLHDAVVSRERASYPYKAVYVDVNQATAEGNLTFLSASLDGNLTVANDLILATNSAGYSGYYSPSSATTVGGAVRVNAGQTISLYNEFSVSQIILNGGTANFDYSRDNDSPITVEEESTISISGVIDVDGKAKENTVVLSGAITLNADLIASLGAGITAKFTGSITKNGHEIREGVGSRGTLMIGDTVVETPKKETVLDGDNPFEFVVVSKNETAILNGTRGYVQVLPNGVLKGEGTALAMYVERGGLIAPGNSPGRLTILEDFTLAGGYTFEFLSKDIYDQLVVGEDYIPSTSYPSAVVLESTATLNIQALAGWSVAQGDTFTIIDNLSDTPVSGTFAGLPEGAQITVGNAVFSISYVGGDGNDVVLTALLTATAPATPNTGVATIITANPAIVLALGVVTVLAVAIVARRAKQ